MSLSSTNCHCQELSPENFGPCIPVMNFIEDLFIKRTVLQDFHCYFLLPGYFSKAVFTYSCIVF